MPSATIRHIALLRALNVGGHTVTMARLRALFEALDFTGVETFIASGNVIFNAPAQDPADLERRIADHLHQGLGYPVATFLRSPAELAAVAEARPFPPAEMDAAGASTQVAFLSAPPEDAARRALLALANERDAFQAHGREVYWLRRPPASQSTFSGALLEKTLGLPATLRNMTTVRRLVAKHPPAPGRPS